MTLTATIAVLALALLVGISLGLLGGGGSILAVPILTGVGGVEPRAAIASSLLIVGTTSAVGLLQHARAGRVRWRVGVVFGAAGVVGALVGGLLGGMLPRGVLMVVLAGTMIAAAVAMLRRRPRKDGTEPARPRIALVLVLGTAVGSLAGLVGAGGGFLIVPALILLAGLPASAAIGTSLLVIAMQSLAGLAAQPALPDIPWALVLPFTAIAVTGSFLGSALTGRIPERALRAGFAVLVLTVAFALLVQQVALHLPLT